MRPHPGVWLCLFAASLAGAASFQEDFATDPAPRGWGVFGETNLFHWNPTNANLEVTWDSSRTNSYFHWPLGTILAQADDFSVEFDLRLDEIAVGVNPQKTFTFEVAVGLLNWQSATSTNWQRGSGRNALHGPRNLAEFDYFPDSGYGATISPTLASSNNLFATSFSFPLELDAGAAFHIAISHSAVSHALVTTMTRNGQPFGPVQDVVPDATFTDFRLDHFAVCSYSDAGAGGSLFARGVVDNVHITVPPPPVTQLRGGFINAVWQVEFLSATNWLYALEQTTNFESWVAVAAGSGNGGELALIDEDPPAGKAFYRVRAERP